MKMKMKMRNKTEIQKVEQDLCDKLWLMRHLQLKGGYENDEGAKMEQEVRNKISDGEMFEIETQGSFYMGKIEGELSAVRWVLGHEWDMLDT